MKAKLSISFIACVATPVLMSSCFNEENTPTNNQLTAFTGGIVTETPMERVQVGTTEISIVIPGFLTCISMNRGAIDGEGAFLWEFGNKIYVGDDKNELQKSKNAVTETAPRTTSLLGSSYTIKDQYDVYYCGTSTNTGARKVVITGNQIQEAFNNTKHLGAAGDCGVVAATKVVAGGKSGYSFNLKYRAAHLCFPPLISSREDRVNYRIKSIEIASKETNISDTYDLSQDSLSGTGDTKITTLNVGTDGLVPIDRIVNVESIKNPLYVMIAPDNHRLNVESTVFGKRNSKEPTLVKRYKTHVFDANKICDTPVSLGYADSNAEHDDTDGSYELEDTDAAFYYTDHEYYAWDTKGSYWSGHEWDVTDDKRNIQQPTINNGANSNYPKDSKDPRYCRDGKTTGPAAQSSLFVNEFPNVNEMAWYAMKSDAHWNKSIRWSVFGRIHRGGIQLKKLGVITKEQGKSLAELKEKDPGDTDWHTTPSDKEVIITRGKPKNSKIDNYFFLLALGHHELSKLLAFGIGAYYWMSIDDVSTKGYTQTYSLTSYFDEETNEIKLTMGPIQYRYGCATTPSK